MSASNPTDCCAKHACRFNDGRLATCAICQTELTAFPIQELESR